MSELLEDDRQWARSPDEQQVLDLMRRIEPSQRAAALAMLRGLAGPDPPDPPDPPDR